MPDIQRHDYDVIVIGAGGAGLRAAIEAASEGTKVALICKSLLGKAHTVMAEGGAAAALANVRSEDNWKVHFRDTMRGGKFHNNYRMAQLHAQQAPDRIRELEAWGALFDRTPEGRINQRPFGGHTYERLAHVGDRTGLEMIRVLQDKGVHSGIDVYMECTIIDLFNVDGRVAGALGYWRENGRFIFFSAKATVLATGGIGKAWQITSNSWEYTGDGHALALQAGAALTDMEFVQFHPTGMVWPPSVKGILVTEGVRGEGGILLNSEGKRFMFGYVPEMFQGDYAETEAEADNWVTGDRMKSRRPPELLTRDVIARAIKKEVEAGRGSEHGGVYLNVAAKRSPEYIRKKLPSMYHQFKELAGIDITKDPMEVGPTTHYVMGGVKVDPETQESSAPGLFAAGEVAGGMHGANRLGGNSLSDLLVFGRLAGKGAADSARTLPAAGKVSDEAIQQAINRAIAPFDRAEGENPFTVQADLQKIMQTNASIVRDDEGLKKAIAELETLKPRLSKLGVSGNREYNPGWNTAIDLKSQVMIAEAVAKAGLIRTESRGAHTRIDFPSSEKEWERKEILIRLRDGQIETEVVNQPAVPADLQEIIDKGAV